MGGDAAFLLCNSVSGNAAIIWDAPIYTIVDLVPIYFRFGIETIIQKFYPPGEKTIHGKELAKTITNLLIGFILMPDSSTGIHPILFYVVD